METERQKAHPVYFLYFTKAQCFILIVCGHIKYSHLTVNFVTFLKSVWLEMMGVFQVYFSAMWKKMSKMRRHQRVHFTQYLS